MTIAVDKPSEIPDRAFAEEKKEEELVVEDEHAKTCRRMVDELTEDEKEHAARDSYRYLVASTSPDKPTPSNEERDACARDFARRHLVRYKGNEKTALKKLKETIAFRKEFKADELRLSFYDKSPNDEMKKFRDDMEKQVEKGDMYVKGIDKKNRAMLRLDLGRVTAPWDLVPYVQNHIYNYDRALACTERRTNGAEEKINVIVSFQDYGTKNQAPLSNDRAVMTYFGLHWPERMEKAFMVNAPFIFRLFYKLLKPFIDKDTTSRVVFVTGEEQIREVMAEYVDLDEQLPELFQDELPQLIDAKKYMYETPFDRTIDGE